MNEFIQAVNIVEEKCSDLFASAKYRLDKLPGKISFPGVYLLYENGKVLYLGRTNDMRKELKQYTYKRQRMSTRLMSLLNYEMLPDGVIKDLAGIKVLVRTGGDDETAARDAACQRLQNLEAQFIKETDPIKQILLEICVILKIQPQYNDFEDRYLSPWCLR